MFREFFLHFDRSQRFLAWTGLLVFLCHSLFNAFVKWQLNGWYERFYDVMQTTHEDAASNSTSPLFLRGKQEQVTSLLFDFASIVAPVLVVHPVCKFVSSVWRFRWRLALVQSYLAHYDASTDAIEGTAQRIQEDTSRFEEGVYSAFNVVLDSVLTLVVFLPLLIDQGSEAKPSYVPEWFDGWLAYGAVQASLTGLFVSALVGKKLVGLEVENQKVEAKFRTKLVVLEETPMSLVEDTLVCVVPPDAEVLHASVVLDDAGAASELGPRPSSSSPSSVRASVPSTWSPLPIFGRILSDLWSNYYNLFVQFTYFNAWISFFDQTMSIVPYVLVAPLVFAEEESRRITLGQLVKTTNAFSRVFDSLAVVSQSWASINEFRSVLKRLREFEAGLYGRRPFNGHSVYVKINEAKSMVRTHSLAPCSSSPSSSSVRASVAHVDDMTDVEL